ncbi:hypothetical protein CU840_01195 [Salmonella enterica]|nr:hypothetical protein [Salmonella enterica subsp. enterica serovar Florida]EDL7417922.1 hypothetical protein [Salmonella enterica]EEG1558638.1 hypothetical protein [Salmonella enterica subsp. enterica serovar Midway]EEH1320745.1 hypothetical protein [Salmonella enterica subsp. enterica serovar Midway]EKA1617609.1 hypothetical protein [Salmonella enterica]
MKKIITFTIMAIADLYWFFIHPATLSEKGLPANAPFIINSHRPGTCIVSTIATAVDTKQDLADVVCKVQL